MANKGRVRFEGEEFESTDDQSSEPPVLPSALPLELEIKFGLLTAGGVYELDLCNIGQQPPHINLTDPKLNIVITKPPPPSAVKPQDKQQQGGKPILALQLIADRPGPFESTFQLTTKHNETTNVHVTATVIPRHKGTPAPKNNVRCIGSAAADTDIE